MAKYSKMKVASSSTNKNNLYPLTKSVTEIPLNKFSHLWTIKNFSLIPTDVDFICCPNFSPPVSKDKWFMKLRPKTVDEQTGNEYIGIHLFLRTCEDKNKHQIRAKYIISVLDADGDRRFTGECSKHDGRIFKAGTEGHGYKLLAPRDVLLSTAHNMLGAEDCLQVLCEITVFGDLVARPVIENDEYADVDMTKGSLASDYGTLLTSQRDCDIIIESKDGIEIKAHRIILSTRSKVFYAMFEHQTLESTEKRIKIPDFEGSVLKEMINFIYTDSVGDVNECAVGLLLAADKYDLPKLKTICEKFLADNINAETSGDVLTVADMCNCPKLKEKALHFITSHSSKIVDTESWNSQVAKRPLLYKEVFNAMVKRHRAH